MTYTNKGKWNDLVRYPVIISDKHELFIYKKISMFW